VLSNDRTEVPGSTSITISFYYSSFCPTCSVIGGETLISDCVKSESAPQA